MLVKQHKKANANKSFFIIFEFQIINKQNKPVLFGFGRRYKNVFAYYLVFDTDGILYQIQCGSYVFFLLQRSGICSFNVHIRCYNDFHVIGSLQYLASVRMSV